MPNIRTYTNQQEAGAPNDRAAGAWSSAAGSIASNTAQEGAEIGGGVARIGTQYVHHVARQEITQLGADLATAHAELSVQWNDIANKTNPQDIEKAAEDFRENIAKPRLSKLGDNLQTEDAQDMFAKASSGLEDDLFQKTAGDAARLQGIGAVENVMTVKNQLTTSVFADPTSFPTAMSLMRTTLDGMQGNFHLPSDKRAALETDMAHDLAKSTALGMLQANPTQGKADIADGRFDKYLSGEEIATLQAHGDELVRAQTTAQKAQEEALRRAQKEQSDQYADKIVSSLVMSDGSMSVPADVPKAVVNYMAMPGVTPADGRAMADMVERIVKDGKRERPVASDPATYQSLMGRAILPGTDPQALTLPDVYRAVTAGTLSQKDGSYIIGAFNNMQRDPGGKVVAKQVDDFLKAMKPTITKSNPVMGFLDGKGDRDFYDFSVQSRAMIQQGLSNGQPIDKILDGIRTQVLPKYATDTKAALTLMNNQFAGHPQSFGPSVPRNAGETPAQYLSRVSSHAPDPAPAPPKLSGDARYADLVRKYGIDGALQHAGSDDEMKNVADYVTRTRGPKK